MMNIKCQSCNTTFQDNGSLEVHYQYTHHNSNNNSSSDCPDASTIVDSTETNNKNNNNNNNNNIHHSILFNIQQNICQQQQSQLVATDSASAAVMTAISPGVVHSSGNNDSSNRNENAFSISPATHSISNLHNHNHNHNNHNHNSPYDLNHLPVPPVSQSPYPPTPDQNYILGISDDFPRAPPSHNAAISNHTSNSGSSANVYPFAGDQRFHPYYKPGFRDPRSQISSPVMPPSIPPLSSTMRCEKCDFLCSSQEMLIHHMNVHHGPVVPPIPMGGMHGAFNHRFPPNNPAASALNNGAEPPQAEILDLDSHKVHVYQPPNGQDPDGQQDPDQQNSALESWMQDTDKKYFHQMHMSQQNGSPRGGGTPLSSPDFGNVSTTTDNIENLQSAFQFDPNNASGSSAGPTTGGSQISSSDRAPSSGKGSGKGGKSGNNSWKSNEPRRPKTYNCSACNKWFTSSGHLKRHYNTTLHKNAVKQSGAPDPATMPISAHHHPHKDPAYVPSNRQMKNSTPKFDSESTSSAESSTSLKLTTDRPPPLFPPTRTPTQQIVSPSSAVNSFLHNSPNLMAGPSELPGGLLPHPSYTTQCSTPELIKSPSPIISVPQHSNLTNYLPFTAQPQHHLQFFQQATPNTLYPNFQSPHVSTILQATTNNHTGNLDNVLLTSSNSCSYPPIAKTEPLDEEESDLNSLPSFSYIPKDASNNNNGWNYSQCFGLEQFLSTLDNGNVGGYSSKSSIDDNINTGGNSRTSTTSPNEVASPSISGKEDDSFSCDSLSTMSSSTEKANKFGHYIKRELVDEDVSPLDSFGFDHVPLQRDDSFEKENFYTDENSDVSSSTAELSQESPSPPSTTKGPFLCEKCDKAFNRACYLTQHNKSFHSGYKPFKCTRCGKRFNEAKQYKTHTEKHAGDKPHKCEICPKQFNHKTDLRRHVCLHTNIRPHKCDLCFKGFIRKDHMLKHRETHTNKRQIVRRVKIQKIKSELELEILCN